MTPETKGLNKALPAFSPAPQAGFARILVPTDFSEPAQKSLAYALALSGESVQLAHVIAPPSYTFPEAPLISSSLEHITSLHLQLEQLARGYSSPSRHLSTSVRLGDPARQIAALARDWEADLLVISTHGRTGLSHLVLGSVAEGVIRRAPCPVLVLRKHQRGILHERAAQTPQAIVRRILVPTDFSVRSRRAIFYALDFRARYGGEITLVHAVETAQLDRVLARLVGVSRDEVLRFQREEATERLAQLADGLRFTVRDGSPVEVVAAMASQERFDLVICATHSSSVVREAFLGSTAEGFVRHVDCPVLIVPSGAGR